MNEKLERELDKYTDRILRKLSMGLFGITKSYCEYAVKFYIERNYILYNIYMHRAIETEKSLRSQELLVITTGVVIRSYKAKARVIAKKEGITFDEAYEMLKPTAEKIITILLEQLKPTYVDVVEDIVKEYIKDRINEEYMPEFLKELYNRLIYERYKYVRGSNI